MTIKELKKRLRGYPDNTEILIKIYDDWGNSHNLPCMDEAEICSCEQGGEFTDAIILEANVDALTEN